jgi:hypothetical protein
MIMARKLKQLGLALVAVFALGAMSASVASAAEEFWFKSDGDWTMLVGKQKVVNGDVFTTDAGKVTCEETTYSGSTAITTDSSITLRPTFSGCEIQGIGFSTIDMNKCGYVFTADKLTAGPKYDVETEIECENVGEEITVTTWLTKKVDEEKGTIKCTIHITQQKLGTGMVLTNNGKAPNTIEAVINLSGIKYTQTAGTGLGKCTTTGETANGSYIGEVIIEGKNTAGEETEIALSTT